MAEESGFAAGPEPSGVRKEKDDLSSSASSPLKSMDDHPQTSSALKRRLEFTEKGKGNQLSLTQGKGEDGITFGRGTETEEVGKRKMEHHKILNGAKHMTVWT